MQIISTIYSLLWGDLFTLPLPGGNTIGISLMYQLLEKMQPGRVNPLSDKQIHAEFVLRESMGRCQCNE